MLVELPVSIYRGGTSKGVFIDEGLLPLDIGLRDAVLLKVMGSPDLRQIDGLGGAVSTTSKVAIIAKAEDQPWDVNYTFAQVAIDQPLVSYAGNCGNISSAVGIYAIENSLVETTDPVTKVAVYNTNTKKVINQYIPTPQGQLTYEGDFEISGVPGKGLKIELEFLDPAGAFSGKLLPTGQVTDAITLEDDRVVTVSIVDAANPLVYLRAEALGLQGTEWPEQIDADATLLGTLEEIRGKAAVLMGLITDYRDSATQTPGVPKMTLLAPAQDYQTTEGETIPAQAYHLSVRMMSMQKAHKSIALTGALCTGAACQIEGTLPHELVKDLANVNLLELGHSSGKITVSTKFDYQGDEVDIQSVSSYRTARKILVGQVYYQEEKTC